MKSTFLMLMLLQSGPVSQAPAKEPGPFSLHIQGNEVFMLDSLRGQAWVLKKEGASKLFWSVIEKVEPATIRRADHLTLSLVRAKAGYLLLPITIGKHEIRMMVDTGAPTTHLDRARTQKFVNWKPLKNGPGQQQFFPATTEAIALLKDIHVGGIQARELLVADYDCTNLNQALAFFGDEPIDGQLGADFLSQFRAVIDFANLQIQLQPPIPTRKAPKGGPKLKSKTGPEVTGPG